MLSTAVIFALLAAQAACFDVPPADFSVDDNGGLDVSFEGDEAEEEVEDAEVKCTTYPCKIFEDNFDTLDFKKWEHEITMGGGGNWEFQMYTNNRKNSYTKNGTLYLKPTLTSEFYGEETVRTGTVDLWGASPANLCTGNAFWGCQRSAGGGRVVNPVMSARLRSVHSFAFQYGKLEVEAKMPTGDWIWPAIWLLPKHNEYGEWPASGEIDLVEARGNENLFDSKGVHAGIKQMGQTMHWGPRYNYNGYLKTHATKNLNSGTWGSSFHRYQLEWGPDIGLKFGVDDETIMTVNPQEGFWKYGRDIWKDMDDSENPWQYSGATRLAPFDKPFYIIMNTAVGGTNYFSDNLVNRPYPKPWRNDAGNAMGDFYNAKNQWYPTWKNEESAMQVNYVRVWKTKPDQ